MATLKFNAHFHAKWAFHIEQRIHIMSSKAYNRIWDAVFYFNLDLQCDKNEDKCGLVIYFFEILSQKYHFLKKKLFLKPLSTLKSFWHVQKKMLENALGLKTYTTKICHPHVTLVSRKCSNFCTKKEPLGFTQKFSVFNP